MATTWDSYRRGSASVLANIDQLLAASTGAVTVGASRAISGKTYFEVVARRAGIAPAVCFNNVAGWQASLKLAAADFVFGTPSGFSAWEATSNYGFEWTYAGSPPVVLSNANQTASGNGAAFSNTVRTTGKFYFEVNVDAAGSVTSWANLEIGLALITGSVATQDMTHNGTYACGVQSKLGDIAYNSAAYGSSLGALTAGDRVCVAVDIDNQVFWFRRNGGPWNGSATADPASNAGGLASFTGLFAAMPTVGVGIADLAMNFSQQLGADNNGLALRNNGAVTLNNAILATIQTFAEGDTVCVAVDPGARQIWFRTNGGAWNNNAGADPAAGSGGISYATMNVSTLLPAAGASATRAAFWPRFTSFAQTVPSGFSSVDTIQAAAMNADKALTGSAQEGGANSQPVNATAQATAVPAPARGWYGYMNLPPTAAANPPVPLAAVLPGAALAAAYSETISAKGGAAPYSFGVIAGSLPPGLSLDASTGVIAGAPTTAAVYGFTIQVTDAAGVTGRAAFSITVLPSEGSGNSGYGN
jgi:hypothetical protein